MITLIIYLRSKRHFSKLAIERSIFNKIKGVYNEHTVRIILNNKMIKAHLCEVENKAGVLTITAYIQHVRGHLITLEKGKEKKTQIVKKNLIFHRGMIVQLEKSKKIWGQIIKSTRWPDIKS